MDGSAATGRTISVLGNDVIEVEGDKIRSVDVTYDRQAADEQLGAQRPKLRISNEENSRNGK
jgi:hypothetical protein